MAEPLQLLHDVFGHDAFRPGQEDAVQAASALAGEGWGQRLGTGPRGPGELFLAAAYAHVRARSGDEAFYSLEAEPQPLGEDLLKAVDALARGLTQPRRSRTAT